MTVPQDTESAKASRDRSTRIAGGVVAAAAAALVVVLIVTSAQHPARPVPRTTAAPQPHVGPAPAIAARPVNAQLTVSPQAPLIAIPHSFLGISTEYWTLPVDERHIALYRRVLSLLHVPGDGPLILRVGGDSSDHTFYDPRILKLPRWAFDLTPVFIQRTARIVREMKLHLILDLNLITATPMLAAAWAQEAEAAMPKGSIIGFEVGNEPDLYNQSFWLQATEHDKFDARVLPRHLTPADYAQDFVAYSRALAKVAPGVPLYGPALAYPNTDANWAATLLAGPHPGLKVISVHRYPYSACAFPGSPEYPTIARILSQQASAGMAESIRPALVIARRAGLPLRLTEINSVTCGGLRRVSNTFATALWAPDAIFELMRIGVSGVNLHARESAINDPFTFGRYGMKARPLLYGLILFARTLGPDAKLITTSLRSARSLNLKAWVVKVSTDTLHVLLMDKGAKSVTVSLNLPATRAATIERLLAPSPRSTRGERLDGQYLDFNGNWRGKRVTEIAEPVANRYLVTLPRYSAALVTVPLTPVSLTGAGPGSRSSRVGQP